jgi:hypothetical protein
MDDGIWNVECAETLTGRARRCREAKGPSLQSGGAAPSPLPEQPHHAQLVARPLRGGGGVHAHGAGRSGERGVCVPAVPVRHTQAASKQPSTAGTGDRRGRQAPPGAGGVEEASGERAQQRSAATPPARPGALPLPRSWDEASPVAAAEVRPPYYYYVHVTFQGKAAMALLVAAAREPTATVPAGGWLGGGRGPKVTGETEREKSTCGHSHNGLKYRCVQVYHTTSHKQHNVSHL